MNVYVIHTYILCALLAEETAQIIRVGIAVVINVHEVHNGNLQIHVYYGRKIRLFASCVHLTRWTQRYPYSLEDILSGCGGLPL